MWDAIGDVDFIGFPLVCLAFPWALAALLAVISHFFVDEAGVKDDLYYFGKLVLLDCSRLQSINDDDIDSKVMLQQIIDDTHEELISPKESTKKWNNMVKWLERFTFGFLVLGFIWSLTGPLLLACYVRSN